MSNFSTDDIRTLFDSVCGEEFYPLTDSPPGLEEEVDLFEMAGSLLSSVDPLSGMDLSLSDLCTSDANSSPHSFYDSVLSAPQSPMSTISSPPSPPRHLVSSVKSPKAPQVPSSIMPSRKPAGSVARTFHPYGDPPNHLRGTARETPELRGGPKRHRKTIQRKRQEQMARLETLTAAQHELRETVRVAAEEVQHARRTLYSVLKTARQGALPLSRPASSLSKTAAGPGCSRP